MCILSRKSFNFRISSQLRVFWWHEQRQLPSINLLKLCKNRLFLLWSVHMNIAKEQSRAHVDASAPTLKLVFTYPQLTSTCLFARAVCVVACRETKQLSRAQLSHLQYSVYISFWLIIAIHSDNMDAECRALHIFFCINGIITYKAASRNAFKRYGSH